MEIKRDVYLNELVRKQRNGFVKVITGLRRCGKSYLMRTIFKNHLLSNGIQPQQRKLITDAKLKETLGHVLEHHPDDEVLLNIEFRSREAQPLIDKGQVLARQQFDTSSSIHYSFDNFQLVDVALGYSVGDVQPDGIPDRLEILYDADDKSLQC